MQICAGPFQNVGFPDVEIFKSTHNEGTPHDKRQRNGHRGRGDTYRARAEMKCNVVVDREEDGSVDGFDGGRWWPELVVMMVGGGEMVTLTFLLFWVGVKMWKDGSESV